MAAGRPEARAHDRRTASFTVRNQTTGVGLGSEVEPARSVWARMKGLIGRSRQEFTPGRGLWIVSSQGIHTIGMRFPIDAAYLDKKGHIIRQYHRLPPGRLAALNWKTRSVLELPAGTLERTGTQVGDVLEFLPNEKGDE